MKLFKLFTCLVAVFFFVPRGDAAFPAGSVVVYTALDREFSEPILKAYSKETGVKVLPKFDVESTKTVGLTNLLIAERARPTMRPVLEQRDPEHAPTQKKGPARSLPSQPCGRLAHALQSEGRHLVWLRGAWAYPDRQQQARGGGRSSQGNQRPPRPEVEGQDRHRQAPLRHDRDSRHLPLRRLG